MVFLLNMFLFMCNIIYKQACEAACPNTLKFADDFWKLCAHYVQKKQKRM